MKTSVQLYNLEPRCGILPFSYIRHDESFFIDELGIEHDRVRAGGRFFQKFFIVETLIDMNDVAKASVFVHRLVRRHACSETVLGHEGDLPLQLLFLPVVVGIQIGNKPAARSR